ncbi:MAG TPA: IS30 family transposase [Thermoclostridium sp.]|nr:IS30 family transposase [Thermoclostridium sp.]
MYCVVGKLKGSGNGLQKEYGDKFKDVFKTITVDNGSEFLNYKSLERCLNNPEEKRTKVYYCHPYTSWERDSNENSNKLIRRFILKGTDISRFTQTKKLFFKYYTGF